MAFLAPVNTVEGLLQQNLLEISLLHKVYFKSQRCSFVECFCSLPQENSETDSVQTPGKEAQTTSPWRDCTQRILGEKLHVSFFSGFTCAGCISRGPRRKQKVREETPGRPGWTGSRETSEGVRPGRALGLLTLGSRSCPETRRQAGTWRGWLYTRPPAGAVACGGRPRCPTVTQGGRGHGYPASTLPPSEHRWPDVTGSQRP